MKTCPICGSKTPRPILAALEHFKVWELNQLKYMRGNIKAFGLVDGFMATIYLMSPIINTLRHWKYRKHHLKIGEFRE